MKKKRITSFIMVAVMLLGAFGGSFAMVLPVFANPTVQPLGDVTVKSIQPGKSLMNNGKGTLFPHTVDFIKYSKDGKEWPAYCIQPKKPGAQVGGDYIVNGQHLLENPKIYGAIVNGYPFKTASELGVDSDYEAFYATKMAIWTILGTPNHSFTEMKPNGSVNQDVYEAYKKIYEAGNATTNMNNTTLTASEVGTPVAIEGNEIHTFSVSPANVGYTIAMDGTQPSGTQITDIDGTPKTSFNADEKFKVVIPQTSITANGSFKLKVTATSDNGKALVYEGVPKTNPGGSQNYALVYEGKLEGSGIVNYEKKDDTTTPPPNSGSGKLLVIKKQAGTLIPLAGAEIKLTKADGGVYDIKPTDANGEATFENLPFGEYFVEEITPPHGHLLDINSHKDIVLIKDKSQQTVTFENEKTPTLEIIKKDAETGQPVPNTVFEVSLDGGTEKYTITTDGTGSAKLGLANILKPGTYKVRETLVPEPYLLW